MAGGKKLMSALDGVDWRNNINSFGSDPSLADRLAALNYGLALWSGQLETVERGNMALSFIREAQAAGHYVACLVSLALYKPAAASMRLMVECVLQYSYFRLHLAELATLRRDLGFFMDKKSIIEYHRKHTEGFSDKQQALGAISRLDTWYGRTSAIIHGQEPGKWVTHWKIEDIAIDKSVCAAAITEFEEAGEIVRRILLCTLEEALWQGFNQDRKTAFLRGLRGGEKDALGLTIA